MSKRTDTATYNSDTAYLAEYENTGKVMERGEVNGAGPLPAYWRNADVRVTAQTRKRGTDKRTLAQHVKAGTTRVELNASIVLTIAALCAIHGDVELPTGGRAADQLVREYRSLQWVHNGHQDPRWVLSLGFDLRSAMSVCEGGWESISLLVGETFDNVGGAIRANLDEAVGRYADLLRLEREDKERNAQKVG